MKLKNTKLREGDEVIVITGREKGKRGNIKSIMGEKCIINDLNLAKTSQRTGKNIRLTLQRSTDYCGSRNFSN